jgi:hypothetical protein
VLLRSLYAINAGKITIIIVAKRAANSNAKIKPFGKNKANINGGIEVSSDV